MVEKIARLFLRLAEDGLQLIHPLQFLDHSRTVSSPMVQNQDAQASHVVHLLSPFQVLGLSLYTFSLRSQKLAQPGLA
jgi:hypothetical protein